MIESEQTTNVSTSEIDQTIGRMEHLYRAMTGRDMPAAGRESAGIPAEKDPAEHVERQLNRLLKALGDLSFAAPGTAWIPPMCVWESADEILVSLDLPGVPRDSVQLLAQGNVLTITGQRLAEPRGDFELRSCEQATGPFRRTLLVPNGTRTAEPVAEMKQGVLEIRIQKEVSRTATAKTVRVN